MKVIRNIYLAGFVAFAGWQIYAGPHGQYAPIDVVRVAGISALWPAVLIVLAMYEAHMIHRPGEEYDKNGR
jgi:hypothetical protein